MARKPGRKISPKPAQRLERFAGNPVLKPVHSHQWESKAVFNPAALYEEGKSHILYRAIGDSDTSVIGYASSTDGFHIDERLDEPAYVPSEVFEGVSKENPAPGDREKKLLLMKSTRRGYAGYTSGGGGNGGCEDPRLTRIENRIYMTYVAYDGYSPPRVAMTSIHADDFLAKNWQWETPVLISPPGVVDKNACILPETIESKYVIFHRIFPDILIDFVDGLDFDGQSKWLKGEYSIKPRPVTFWDSRKVGVGATPMKTAEGWLLIYQGIGERDPLRYKVGAMLLDLKDPTKVVARLKEPILEPDAVYENEGWKSGVVYPCGAVIRDGLLLLYYGGADTVTCIASVRLEDLLAGFS